jgi:hypothetical protein
MTADLVYTCQKDKDDNKIVEKKDNLKSSYEANKILPHSFLDLPRGWPHE